MCFVCKKTFELWTLNGVCVCVFFSVRKELKEIHAAFGPAKIAQTCPVGVSNLFQNAKVFRFPIGNTPTPSGSHVPVSYISLPECIHITSKFNNSTSISKTTNFSLQKTQSIYSRILIAVKARTRWLTVNLHSERLTDSILRLECSKARKLGHKERDYPLHNHTLPLI